MCSDRPLSGDPHQEYLRIQAALVRGWTYADPLPELVDRLVTLRTQLDPDWLATVRTCTTPPAPIDLARLIPEMAVLRKTTVRLNPRPGSSARDASKIGGVFLWPAEEEWPYCEEHESAFVPAMQLRKEDFPEVEFQNGTDLMQVLWCPNDHEPAYCPDVRVVWRQRDVVTDPVEAHPVPNPDDDFPYVPAPCVFYPERIVEFPDPFESLSESRFPESVYETLAKSPEVAAALEFNRKQTRKPWSHLYDGTSLYQRVLSTADGTKLSGYPDWVQDPWYPQCVCGSRMEHLVSFASQEFDGATWYRWLPVEERDILLAEHGLQESVVSAADCMFGDAGNMYVFICRRCPGWPTVAGMQGS